MRQLHSMAHVPDNVRLDVYGAPYSWGFEYEGGIKSTGKLAELITCFEAFSVFFHKRSMLREDSDPTFHEWVTPDMCMDALKALFCSAAIPQALKATRARGAAEMKRTAAAAAALRALRAACRRVDPYRMPAAAARVGPCFVPVTASSSGAGCSYHPQEEDDDGVEEEVRTERGEDDDIEEERVAAAAGQARRGRRHRGGAGRSAAGQARCGRRHRGGAGRSAAGQARCGRRHRGGAGRSAAGQARCGRRHRGGAGHSAAGQVRQDLALLHGDRRVDASSESSECDVNGMDLV